MNPFERYAHLTFERYAHLTFDANCNLSFIKWMIELHNKYPDISPILSPYFTRDISVFLFEAFKLLEKDAADSAADESLAEFRSNLRIMRNNMHQLVTRDKEFKDESERINTSTEQLRSLFKTSNSGAVSLFSHDIGLARAKIPEESYWITSTLFAWFLLDRTTMINQDGPIGEKIQEHSAIITQFIGGLSEALNLQTGNMLETSLVLPFNGDQMPTIFHEDIKLSQIEKRTGFPIELTYTLLVIADEIGQTLFFVNYLIDKEAAFQDDHTLFYLTRLMAIRYDEIFDTLWKFRNRSDYKSTSTELFDLQLTQLGIVPQKQDLRDFGKALRNSIHYERTPWPLDNDGSQAGYVNVFLKITDGVNWPTDYIIPFLDMENQLEKLYYYLIGFFDIKGVPVDV
jgi:hypothetical protein